MTTRNLVFKAGPRAFDSVRRHGFAAERIGTFAGASGGAKWLVLSHLDRALIGNVIPRLEGPVHLIATSIGAWRSGLSPVVTLPMSVDLSSAVGAPALYPSPESCGSITATS